jgi:hypothetical protein
VACEAWAGARRGLLSSALEPLNESRARTAAELLAEAWPDAWVWQSEGP